MKARLLILFIGIVSVLFIGIIIGPGCANIIPPQGGPRDSLPPILVKANPRDSTRNFHESKINFSFDEFVSIQDIQSNLVISPNPKSTPTVDYKLNTVTVKLRDTLEANTTYSMNFGNAIKDVNEGNIMKDFTYVFSTGPYIDSLELTGKVILAEDGKIDTTMIVMLYANQNDSAVIKEKPRYITKLDGKGGFRFKNLPPSTFYLYALKDEGGTRRYMSDNQMFAFADSPMVIRGSNSSVTLYAWNVKAKSTDAPAPAITQALGNRGRLLTGNAKERLKFSTNLISGQQDLLGDFILTFDQPIRNFDSTKIRLSIDTGFRPVTTYSLVRDSTNRKLILKNTWNENSSYHLILDKDFADDSTGKKLLKTDTLTFLTKRLSEYGLMTLTFKNLDMAKNPVLIFLANNSVFRTVPLTAPTYSQPLFLPGEYELRMLYDRNKNGKWDPGEFFGKHKQPELVKPIDKKISIKAGVENNFEIVAPEETPKPGG
jgi:Bacterial Ig-like domain